MPSDDVVVKDRTMRNRLLEFLVDKRSRSLDYLRVLHSSGDVLWMNTVRLALEDLDVYFDVEGDGVGSRPPVVSFASSLSPLTSSPTVMEKGAAVATPVGTKGASSPNGVKVSPSAPSKGAAGARASIDWVDSHCMEWLVLGLSLGCLVQLPLAGIQLLDAVNDMLLEFDVYFASGSTSRVLASRALKKDREERGLKNDEGVQRIVTNGGFLYLRLPACRRDSRPSYRTLVPPLCSTLQFIYRKLCDYDISAEQATMQKLLLADRKLKHIFFGAISKELAKLAAVKVQQERLWLMDAVFGSFATTGAPSLPSPAPQAASPLTLLPKQGTPTSTPVSRSLATPSASSTATEETQSRQDRDSVDYYFDEED